MSKERLPRLLDIEGVTEHLGVSERHVRRLVAERRIPFIKWGHLLRFDPDEVGRGSTKYGFHLPTMSQARGNVGVPRWPCRGSETPARPGRTAVRCEQLPAPYHRTASTAWPV